MSYKDGQLLCVTTDGMILTLALTDLESELLQGFPHPDKSVVATAMVSLVTRKKTTSSYEEGLMELSGSDLVSQCIQPCSQLLSFPFLCVFLFL